MKYKKDELADQICTVVFDAMKRHGIETMNLGGIFNSLKIGNTVYYKFDPRVWACDCSVSLDIICKERPIPFLASEPTEFKARVLVSWGSYHHDVVSGAVALREYGRALAFATELEAALRDIEVKKE